MMDGIETIDELIEAIADYLGWEKWQEIGPFMETIESALRLPLAKRMSWSLSSPTPYALLMRETMVAYGSGETLQEAICRAWLMWKRANDIDYINKQAKKESAS